MGATIKILIISATIVIPWAIIRIADLETKITFALAPLMANDKLILGLLVIPPLALWLIQWLFLPRSKAYRRSSGNRSILFRFWG